MYKIQTLNKISEKGLELLKNGKFEVSDDVEDPHGILVRSAKLHDMSFGDKLCGIARAGAGVNNIPVEKCSEHGVVVFNTPGANANSVKELVISGLLLSSRRIHQGLSWAETLKGKGEEVTKLVEAEKNQFAGPEIAGKTLGVFGLGAIGVMVCNAACSLGMDVIGYDPYISVESAWGLHQSVRRATTIDGLLAEADFVTLHVPLNDATTGMIDEETLSKAKPGMRLLNFARGPLVNNADLLKAIDKGIVATYVTDFPEDELLGNDRVLPVPHLGASTPEAEENCAIMAARQLSEFLVTGNIRNSVNFPDCYMDPVSNFRLVVANRNIPNMVGQITTVLAGENINILDLLNRHRDSLAYNIIDLDGPVSQSSVDKINQIDGVIKTTTYQFEG